MIVVNPLSEDWLAVSAKASEIASHARSMIEAPGISEREADFERGRISAMKSILKLAEDDEKRDPDA